MWSFLPGVGSRNQVGVWETRGEDVGNHPSESMQGMQKWKAVWKVQKQKACVCAGMQEEKMGKM